MAVTSPGKSMVAGASKGRGIGRGNFYRPDRPTTPRRQEARYFIDVQIPVSVSALDRPAFDRTPLCLFLGQTAPEWSRLTLGRFTTSKSVL